jgi:hypothetical protein
MRSMPRLPKDSVWYDELVSETETEEARFGGKTVGRKGSEWVRIESVDSEPATSGLN